MRLLQVSFLNLVPLDMYRTRELETRGLPPVLGKKLIKRTILCSGIGRYVI